MPIVELFGAPRLLSGVTSIEVEGATVRACLLAAEAKIPQLAKKLLADKNLSPAYRICLDGLVFSDNLDTQTTQTTQIIVLAADVGG